MPGRLAVHITGLVATCAIALVVTSLRVSVQPQIRLGIVPDVTLDTWLGVAFWTGVTAVASALPVRMPHGTVVSTSTAPIVAVMILGGPTAAAWVALIGTSEIRELRGQVPWYGVLANHAGLALPATIGGVVGAWLGLDNRSLPISMLVTLAASVAFLITNVTVTALSLSFKTGQSPFSVVRGDAPTYAITFLALVPLAWLVAQVYPQAGVGWWSVLLIVLPVYIIRLAMDRYVEMREMFTQTIGALSGAVDARDEYTANHSKRVQQISVDIGREMRLSQPELEALEWGGLLHDVGKIGVRDAVLLKQDKLTRDERTEMNLHPVIGATIIAPVARLAPELPIIRHHHEWYNGSGYPDRLIGDEIPKLARVLHVADAFEAMTAARPYRMRPLTTEQALAELRKYSGVQFDPAVVDAFVRTEWAAGAPDPGRPGTGRPVPLLAHAAGRMAQTGVETPPQADAG